MFKRISAAKSSVKPAKSATSRPKGFSTSVIAVGMHVLGNIVSEGALDIDGKINGNVRGQTISIRPNGVIIGDVVADVVHVYGTVEGLIKAKNVLLYADARVTGTIMHEAITIEDGAFVDGKFKRTDKISFNDAEVEMARRMQMPAIDPAFDGENDNEEPSEAEIKILENLRLIS